MTEEIKESNVISFAVLVPKEHFDLPLLNEKLLGKKFSIMEVEFGESQFGEYSIVTTDKGVFRVSSTVLNSQLHLIKKALAGEYDEVTVKIKKVKNYFTFE